MPADDIPETIGRYRVDGELGRGGMATVYAAHDPELDRAVAIKVMHGAAGPARQEVLAREGQVMARLAHPNLLRVFDVGIADRRLYVVMERVEGETLRHWMDAVRRPWRDVLDRFLAAARGLAAAHRAGVVHRDFKPDNVLLDRIGRVLVGDFGPLSGGTPAYMAPEQHLGREVDARSDQFSFCVALYEGLYGERPFVPDEQLDTVHGYGVEVIGERVRKPAGGAPRWLWRVVRRGLMVDPDARFPSMDALVAAVESRRKWPRRLAITGGMVAIAIGAAGAALLWSRTGEDGARPCALDLDDRDPWRPSVRARVEARFDETGLGFAPATFSRVDRGFSVARERWKRTTIETCEAHARGERSQDLADRGAACLDRAWQRLDALATRLTQSLDRDAVEHAVNALAAADRELRACDDLDALLHRPALPADPLVRAQVAMLSSRLSAARAEIGLGHYDRGREEATAVVAEARATAFKPLLAEALLTAGDAQERAGDYPTARITLYQAIDAASESGDSDVEVKAMGELLRVVGYDLRDLPAAGELLRLVPAGARRASDAVRLEIMVEQANVLVTMGEPARAVTLLREVIAEDERLGSAPLDRATTLLDLGLALEEVGDFSGAREVEEHGLALLEELLGPQHPSIAAALNNLGTLVQNLSDWKASGDYLARALAVKEAIYEPDHPSVALALHNLAIVRTQEGKLAESRRLLTRAIEIRIAKLGPEHPLVGSSLGQLATVAREEGKLDEATDLLERALEIRVKAEGVDHPGVAYPLVGLARIDMLRGDTVAARAHLLRALAIRTAALGARHTDTAEVVGILGELALLERDWPEAERRAADAAERFESGAGRDDPYVGYNLNVVGAARVEAHRPRDAIEPLERALAILDEDPASAWARYYLARARWEIGGTGDRAVQLTDASRAADALPDDPLGARARRWIATRLRKP